MYLTNNFKHQMTEYQRKGTELTGFCLLKIDRMAQGLALDVLIKAICQG